jgi:hypothetical protein
MQLKYGISFTVSGRRAKAAKGFMVFDKAIQKKLDPRWLDSP